MELNHFTNIESLLKICNPLIYSSQLLEMYKNVYGEPEHNQYVQGKDLHVKLCNLFENSTAIIALNNNQIVGCLIYTAIKNDSNFPESLKNRYSETVYIAEVMVLKPFRGKGLATIMFENFFEICRKTPYHNIFIRVRSSNVNALALYRKLGFIPIAYIEQPAIKMDGITHYQIHKTYLHKTIN